MRGDFRHNENKMVNMLAAEERIKADLRPEVKLAWMIANGTVVPDEQYTIEWASKILSQKNKLEMQLLALSGLNHARKNGDINLAAQIASTLGPYVAKKEPVSQELTGADGEKLTIIMDMGLESSDK